MAHFEQDNTYNDMDGNLRQFKFRDYSNAGKNRQKAMPASEEAKVQATKEHNNSIYAIVDNLIAEVPAIFAREVEEVIDINNDRIEWNREALFIALKHWGSCFACMHISSIWSRVEKSVFNSIKEHINCKDLDCRDKVQKWRDHFRKTQTL